MTLGTFGASVVGRPRLKTIRAICPALLPPDALIHDTPSSLDRVSGGCWSVDLHRMQPSAGDSPETEEARPNCMHWLDSAASRDARADDTYCEHGSETTCGYDCRDSRCDILGRASRCAYCVGLRSPCSNVDAAPEVPWSGTRCETTEGVVNFDGALTSARSNVNAHSCRRCRKRRQPVGVSSRWSSVSRTLFDQEFSAKWKKRFAFDVNLNTLKHEDDADRHGTLRCPLTCAEGRSSGGAVGLPNPQDLTTNFYSTLEASGTVLEGPRPTFSMAGAHGNASTGALSTAASSAVLRPAFMPDIVQVDPEMDWRLGCGTRSTSPAYSVEADEMIDCESDKDEPKLGGLRKGWYIVQTLCARRPVGSASRPRSRFVL